MADKTVYQADREGWYRGEEVAHESPLEPGVWLIPAGAYEDSPPDQPWPDGMLPRRSANRWVMQSMPTQSSITPLDKLAAFLAANPDVAALINNQSASSGGV